MTDATAALRAYVLEDDPDIAALEADLLREMGFTVVTCTRIVELGDLMDVALPHLDGIQATHHIRKACPKTVIIGITGEYAAPTHNAMRAAGAAALVSKDHVMGIHDTILTALEFFLGKAA